MRKTSRKIPIYFGKVEIIEVEDLNEIRDKYNFDANYSFSSTEAMVFNYPQPSGMLKYIMAFEKDPTPKVIAHECYHFVHFVFNDRGIKVETDNDEPGAYLMGWIFEQVYNFINSK